MTFSIVARSTDGESWGVGVASKFLAVGSVVPAAVAQLGAIATQAHANVAYKGLALSHLDEGATAQVALDRLLDEDDGRDHRQVGIIDLDGKAATHTGAQCVDWAGGLTGEGHAIQGNCLAGPEVTAAMETAWLSGSETPFARRLLDALTAGDEAGGDIDVDLRVDDHAAPVLELTRLLGLNSLYLTASTDVEKVHISPALLADLESFAATEGAADFGTWVATNNYEMRVADDLTWIDQQILDIVTRGGA